MAQRDHRPSSQHASTLSMAANDKNIMLLTIQEQVQLMRRVWPTFQVLCQTNWLVGWKGNLRPINQSYAVRILYCLGCNFPRVRVCPYCPRVTVLAPPLRRRATTPQEPIPHHYPNSVCPERPFLCLYDPDADEWNPGLAIADTTVPWTIDWLACYEGWLTTGEWTGGGRHPGGQQ